MIDKLNSLMKHWPKSQFPFPAVNRTNKGWELTALNGEVKAESKHLIGCLNALLLELASKPGGGVFHPILMEVAKYIQDHSETMQNFETLPVTMYAVHTEKDSYVFNDPYSILDSLTIRELRSIEEQTTTIQGNPHKLPYNYRRLIGKALRESQRK